MAGIKYCLATAVLVGSACGGGGGTGVDGGLGGGSGCSLTCLNTLVSLMEGCQPTGTCTEQLIGTTAANVCYSNGIKMQVSMTSLSSGGMSMSMSVKKGGAGCYSMVMTENDADDMTMTFKNASGATVATMGTSAAGDTTVTCPGRPPSVIDSTCNTEMGSANTLSSPPTTDCTQGSCAY